MFMSDYTDVAIPYFQEGEEFMPRDENGKVVFSDVDYVDTWKVGDITKTSALKIDFSKLL